MLMEHREKLLFLVHIEPEFDRFFPDNYLTFVRLAARKFDRVIALDSGIGQGVCKEIAKIRGLEIESWSWGYEFGYDYGNGIEYTIESYGHDATWVPDWLVEMDTNKYDIVIGGGYRGECLLDWESVLDHLDIPYRRWDHIVYG